MIGSVKVELLVGFSHALELLSAVHVLLESEDELVDVALRASTTRFGTAILITESILPIIFVAGVMTRGPNLTISAARRLSMFGEASLLPICRLREDLGERARRKPVETGVLSFRGRNNWYCDYDKGESFRNRLRYGRFVKSSVHNMIAILLKRHKTADEDRQMHQKAT